MTSIVAAVAGFAAGNPGLATLLVFLVAAAESIAIIGAIVPGTPIIVAIGALVALGHLNVWHILAATAAGAIVGDGLSYWVGHRYRDRLRTMWPFASRPGLLARGQAYFERRGASSILIARFVPVIRSTVPIAAGMLGMSVGRFYVANIASALVWAPAHVLPGVLAGTALAGLGAISLRLAVAAGVLLVLGLAAVWIARVAALAGWRWSAAWHARVAAWATARPGSMGRLGRIATAAEHARLRGAIVLIVVAGGCAIGLLALADAVVGREELVRFDAAVVALVASLHTVWTDTVMAAVTRLGGTAAILAASVVTVGWLAWRRQVRLAVAVAAAVAGAALLATLLKYAVHAARPALLTPIEPGFSFPSGHSTMAATVFGLLAWLTTGSAPRPRRLMLASLVMLIAAIGASRIYLAVHWPSDVLGGFLFAGLVVSGFALLFNDVPDRRIGPVGLFAATMAAVLVVAGGQVALYLPRDVAMLQANAMRPTALPSAWAGEGWRAMPTHRTDMAGAAEEPLILQWRGSPASLRATLRANGWAPPPPWSVATADALLRPSTPPLDLPALPVMDRGRLPAFTLVRADPSGSVGRRLVLRAWLSDRVDPIAPEMPLLVAGIVAETTAPIGGLLTLPRRVDAAACPDAAPLLAGLAAQPTDLVLPAADGGCGGAVRLGNGS